MASRPDTQQASIVGSDPATATAVNESKPPAGGETFQAANAKDAFPGRVLSHYRLEERVGAGGMGLLYRATDLKRAEALAAFRSAVKHLESALGSDHPETQVARHFREGVVHRR